MKLRMLATALAFAALALACGQTETKPEAGESAPEATQPAVIEEVLTMPNVIDMTYADAKASVGEIGVDLQLVRTDIGNNGNQTEGKVTYQDPLDGNVVSEGDTITLSVAGPPPAGVTIENAIPVGEAGQIGKWAVTVLEYQPDATAAIHAENMFNNPPKPGMQYALASVRTENTGTRRSDPFYGLNWQFVSTTGKAYNALEEVVPNGIIGVDAIPGGSFAEGTMGAEVSPGDANRVALYLWSNGRGSFFTLN